MSVASKVCWTIGLGIGLWGLVLDWQVALLMIVSCTFGNVSRHPFSIGRRGSGRRIAQRSYD